MGYFSDWSIDAPPTPRQPSTELPGRAERGEGDNARLLFYPSGGGATVYRYFPNQAAAYRAKRAHFGLAYRPGRIECWNVREQIWVG